MSFLAADTGRVAGRMSTLRRRSDLAQVWPQRFAAFLATHISALSPQACQPAYALVARRARRPQAGMAHPGVWR